MYSKVADGFLRQCGIELCRDALEKYLPRGSQSHGMGCSLAWMFTWKEWRRWRIIRSQHSIFAEVSTPPYFSLYFSRYPSPYSSQKPSCVLFCVPVWLRYKVRSDILSPALPKHVLGQFCRFALIPLVPRPFLTPHSHIPTIPRLSPHSSHIIPQIARWNFYSQFPNRSTHYMIRTYGLLLLSTTRC